MKRTVSVFLIVFLTTFSIFPWSQDKYTKIANEAYQAIVQDTSSEATPSKKESGLTTWDKIAIIFGIGTAAGAAGTWLWNKFSKDKYEKVADKAFEAVKNTK